MIGTPPVTGDPAFDIAFRKFGGPTRPSSGIVTVGTGSTRLLPNNPRRVAWLIVNRGAADVSLDFLQAPVAGNGFLLAAQSGSISMIVDEDGEIVTWELFGVVAAGNAAVYVLEVMRS